MTWIRQLYNTYEYVAAAGVGPDEPRLLPMCHTTQNAHIEITLDPAGKLLDARALPSATPTLIPATEDSAGRTGKKPLPHPLCDRLQYIAGDFIRFGGTVTSGFAKNPGEPYEAYIKQLTAWVNSPFGHPKAAAVLTYVQRGTATHDLLHGDVLRADPSGLLLDHWTGARNTRPPIFVALASSASQHESFVRWRVETAGEPLSATWEDQVLIDAWIAFYRSTRDQRGLDMVLGVQDAVLAKQHPKRLRNPRDGAKLISTDDKQGYTYRGRFINADQALGVGFEVSQKAHNALRWLIERKQAYSDGDQVIVIWSPAGKPVPDPFANSDDFAAEEEAPADTAESFARRLASKMAGYRAELGPSDHVVLMGLDSATPGRMAITLYREVTGSDLVDRVERWHEQFAWFQDYGRSGGRDRRFVGAPAPRDIAEAAYGMNTNEKLRRAAVERILPSLIDGTPIARDLVTSAVRRATNPAGFEHVRGASPDWEKCLGIACALFRGAHQERNYKMTLERDRADRGYLYGRLLAVADNIERRALDMAGETRGTNAERLMPRFADRPLATWRQIELALNPYKDRLRSSDLTRGFLVSRERELDEICGLFEPGDYEREARLEGEFLLAFHAQRRELRLPAPGRGLKSDGDAGDQ